VDFPIFRKILLQMKYTLYRIYLYLYILSLFSGCAAVSVYDKTNEFREAYKSRLIPPPVPAIAKVDTIITDESLKTIEIIFSKEFSYMPFRKENVSEIYSVIKSFYGEEFSSYNFTIKTLNRKIEELIPNYYLDDFSEYDENKLPVIEREDYIPVMQNISKPYIPSKGLFNRNILVWPSHGWYYNNKAGRWMWQRARLFQTVEDLGPYAFIIPYLAPMLENAGANVFIPRERDIRVNEVIIDDMSEDYTEQGNWSEGEGEGFGTGELSYMSGINPFYLGKHRVTFSETGNTAEASWVPDIPETGEYAVYISYNSSENNVDDALYTVYHIGGKTEFLINQKAGGGTWLYLGKFKFEKGKNLQTGRVALTNESKHKGKIVSADAVRFGGGMGVIQRGEKTSERPKFVEGSRYWLQFAGMPDTLVYNLNNDTLDYNDDYQSRAEYGNYLFGAPYGPSKDRNVKGLGIPIDLSLAFHTDAGITGNDTTVGTLLIYSVESIDRMQTFPDSVSRYVNRDLADIVQTQIVDDIRAKYDPSWNRRWLWDARYSEATRPNFPSMLLELLSHQNFLDTKFALDPRFRFDVSRSIYKGMLRFLSTQYGKEYIVQPLPVTHFSTQFDDEYNVVLNWQRQPDPLEETAAADRYVIYTRVDNGGWDNGAVTNNDSYLFTGIEPGRIYSFKVTALNEGGESFSSEILSVCKVDNNPEPVLIINGFDRVCAPASVETNTFSGFLDFIDAGVPDKFDIVYTGAQYNFNPDSKWATDDDPGHGASHSDYETKIIAGNTFDFPLIHGKAIKENSYSFVSTSDEAVWDNQVDISKYKFVDLILGEEKETSWPKSSGDSINGTQFKAFPEKFQNVIEEFLKSGGNIFISGAYIGTDLFSKSDSADIEFAKNILKFSHANSYADKVGKVYSVPSSFTAENFLINYNKELNDSIYAVEAPDALYPFDGSEIILRYSENHFGAGTGYKKDYGVVVLGFPFETIINEEDRSKFMQFVLRYFGL
jgi:hypothetical protein